MKLSNASSWGLQGLMIATIVLGSYGCGGGGGSRPQTTPVTLTIRYQGQPVEGATVTLAPQASDGTAATGQTNAQGVVAPRTFPEVPGVVPGNYTVLVAKTLVEGLRQGENLDDADPGQQPTFKELLPPKYKTVATSGLTLQVPSSGSVEKTFELTD